MSMSVVNQDNVIGAVPIALEVSDVYVLKDSMFTAEIVLVGCIGHSQPRTHGGLFS